MNPSFLDLKDIHEPEAIAWWPPALGWWILAVSALLLIILLIWFYNRLTRKTAIKTASKILAEIKQDSSQDNLQKLSALSVLVRRVAISVSPRVKVASLTGCQWLTFLDQSVKGKSFSEGIGQLLVNAPYRQKLPTDLEISQLISLCEDWLKFQTTHRHQPKL